MLYLWLRENCALALMEHLLGEIHQIRLNDFSMQMSPKTVNYDRKNLGFGDGRFLQKKTGFGVGFGYRYNTREDAIEFFSTLTCTVSIPE